MNGGCVCISSRVRAGVRFIHRRGSIKRRRCSLVSVPDAFVLFKTEPSHEQAVYMALAEHADVAEVHALYGEFDLLVRITSTDSKALSDLLMNTFRQIEGVRETRTMIAVEGA